jgi:zona occludens toxin
VFTFPAGSLIVLDEAQKVFRARTTGSSLPDHVAAFETHRHLGLDFWLITQQPSKLDSHVRGLIGRHIHLRATWAGRRLYEWSEYTDTQERSALARASVRSYTLPRKAFSLYRSAEIHTKPARRRPWQLALVPVLAGLGVWLGLHLVERVGGAIQGGASPVSAVSEVSDTIDPPSMPSQSASAPVIRGASLDEYRPRLPQRPETAPLYDSLREPRSMPVVAGCLSGRGTCRCVTQQGTDAFLSTDACESWIASRPFDPWRDPAPPVRVGASAEPRPDAPRAAGRGAADG